MTRTHEKVGDTPAGEGRARAPDARPSYTPVTAARGIEDALALINGRWKLLIMFRLFGGKVLRFSELERAIPDVSQKMLAQQLRQMENSGLLTRTVYPEVPPRVEYALTDWGQSLCPALDALLVWGEGKPRAKS